MNSRCEVADRSNRTEFDAADISLRISAVCFTIVISGCVFNQFVPDALCAEGFAIVGFFYLILGVIDAVRVCREKSREVTQTALLVQAEQTDI
ncbi:MAG: hypothetical protein COA78_11615 [Blastopirellula sp.]|nr:MAG: hypothetical protein COA78_11615 [Blastopirellula sp.]